MRARQRYLLGTLLAAIVVALTSQFTPAAPGFTAAITCPASTTWDDLLQRCV